MSLELQLIEGFALTHPRDAAAELQQLPIAEAREILVELRSEAREPLLRWIAPHYLARCTAEMSPSQAAELVREARQDVIVPVLRQLEGDVVDAVLDALPKAKRQTLRPLLRYPDGCAGALMDPNVLTVSEDMTVGAAIAKVLAEPRNALYYAYVLGQELRLVGVLTLRELMLGKPDDPVSTVMTRDVEWVPAMASWDTLVAHRAWNRIHALPVIDEGRFVGVVRYEALRRVERQLAESRSRDVSAATGAALAELYGVGLRAFFDWTSVLTREDR